MREHITNLPRRLAIIVATTVAVATPVLAFPSPAQAGQPEFGQHVSQCAQVHHLGAEHNPGSHRGVTGWNDMTC